MRLYLAGPMTGLRQAGSTVLNPADIGLHPTWSWADYMRVGLETLTTQAEAVAVLPGWEHSVWTRLEVRIAQRFRLPVHTVYTWHALVAIAIIVLTDTLVFGHSGAAKYSFSWALAR